MAGGGVDLTFREGRVRDLGRVHETYCACFGPEACLRTVAHSRSLFLVFYALQMAAGRCKVSLAESGGRVLGLCMVRRVEGKGASALWLCTALCVLPEARGTGAARRLFEMVQDRPLVGSVEADGPLGMYDRLGWTRTGWQTLVYFDRSSVGCLGRIEAPAGDRPARARARALNHRAFLIEADGVDSNVVTLARRRLQLFPTGVLQLPGTPEVPESARYTAVVREVVFHRMPGGLPPRRSDRAGRASPPAAAAAHERAASQAD